MYKLLVESILAFVISLNRRRIGDAQYLKLCDYNDSKSSSTDFDNALTNTEKILTKTYKRIVTSGKGSRAVAILIPPTLVKLIDLLIKNREKFLPNDNDYLFALPGSTIKWG